MTSHGLRRVAEEVGADFTLLMGDNMYQHGLHDSSLVEARFRETFEDVYARHMPTMSFYAFAGNHDYGEGKLSNVSHQLAYSRRSTAWQFPSLWYKLSREFQADGHNRTLDLLVLDTVVLCGNGPANEDFINQQLKQIFPEKVEHSSSDQLRAKVAQEQWAWLEAELAASTADYLWVTGHYPIWSAGLDGPSQCLIERLRPMLMANGAHYVSGHDHNLQHIHHMGLDMFVVGAGKECCYPPVNLGMIPEGGQKYLLAGWHGASSMPPAPFPVFGGFATFRFGAEAAMVSLHAHNGDRLYAAPPISRRRPRDAKAPVHLFVAQAFQVSDGQVYDGFPALLAGSAVGLTIFSMAIAIIRQRSAPCETVKRPLLL